MTSLATNLKADLLWTLIRPSLLNEKFYPDQLVTDERCQALVEILRKRELALEGPAITPARLGRYSERLLEILIKELIRPEKWVANLPVRESKQTLGEFDFIFSSGGLTEHWEAAIKFYLAVPSAESLKTSSFVGPSLRDRMDLKLRRIFGHQLGLSRVPAGVTALSENGFEAPQSRAFVKGILFYPRDSRGNLTLPPEISPAHSRGWWIEADQLELLSAEAFTVLPRLHWIREFHAPENFEDRLDLKQVQALCHARFSPGSMEDRAGEPICLVELRRGSSGWVEQSRGFIVGPDWYSHASEYRSQQI